MGTRSTSISQTLNGSGYFIQSNQVYHSMSVNELAVVKAMFVAITGGKKVASIKYTPIQTNP